MRFNSSNLSLKRPTAVEATDFLRRNDKMATLLPAIQRMARLQKDCAAILPPMFKFCEILAFEEGQLTLSLPNTSLAAKLKQQIPKLQETLAVRGWQVQHVKLKVQMTKPAEIKEKMRSLELPPAAVEAFDQLSASLEDSKQNSALIDAVKAMVARRRAGGG
ncbi:DciA family protein [Duganella sp. PWIR1]